MHEEETLQTLCVNWFKTKYPALSRLLVHVPNERKCSVQRGAVLRGMGVTAGVADLILFVARHPHHGLHIEMKTPKGRVRDSQKEWGNLVEAQGYKYTICRSLQDFQSIINGYLAERL